MRSPKPSFVACLVLSVSTLLWASTGNGGAPVGSYENEAKRGYMSVPQAVVLGIVEGLTEYLPISSTGHILIAQRAMGIGGGANGPRDGEGHQRKEASDAYAICIQGGAILSVLLLYWGRIKAMAWGFLGRDPAGLVLSFRVALAFIPAALLGSALEGIIKEHLFGPWPIIVAWFTGGIIILGFERWRGAKSQRVAHHLEELSWRGALLIGLIQCAAMWPGVSRSLATILGGLLAGLSLPAAVEFSFLLGVITLGAATLFDAVKHLHVMSQFLDPISMIAGFLSAFASALLAVRWMVGYLERHGLGIFGYYRIALAFVVATLVSMRLI